MEDVVHQDVGEHPLGLRRSGRIEQPTQHGRYRGRAAGDLGPGHLVAAAMTYYDYVRQHVWAAAGMTGTRFLTRPEWQTGRNTAHPYFHDPQGQWTDGTARFRYIVGDAAGDAFTTCADLDRFGRHLWQQRLLDPGHTALTLSGKVPMPRAGTTPGDGNGVPAQANFQCYGPMGALVAGQWVFNHGGGNSLGVSTSLKVYPETDWGVVILSNCAGSAVPLTAALARKLITTER
ncbi:serine hydrolase [Streptomyces sp. NPDC059785]|uniref:serine hydrolase n=1 Tax=Streptomyces sp. NPDC059785 TaxID=3346945 RepID=UPI00364A4F19